jgi:periplasmic protein CpxP/Spy
MNRISPVIFRFLAMSAIALSVPLSALAQQGPALFPAGHEARSAHEMTLHMLRGIDLTDAQRAQIKTIAESQREQIRSAMQNVHDQREALRVLALSDKYDAAAVAAKAEQLGRSEGEMARLVADGFQKVYTVLTPEQRQKIQQRVAQRRERHLEHRG